MTMVTTKPSFDKVPATIPNGTSQSVIIPLAGRRIVAIHMPSAWTAAALTALAADTAGGTFLPVYDDGGAEWSIAVGNVLADRVIIPSTLLAKLNGLAFIKLRSGVAATPVNQGADRAITLTLAG